MATEPRARLGAKLAELTPGDIDVFFFTNGGAEANENALKIARAVTGRQKILARYRSYHGATGGVICGDRRSAALVAAGGARHHPRARSVSRRAAGLGHRRAVAALSRGSDSARGPEHDRRVHPRDRHRHQRHPRAARRLPAGRPRALRQARHPDDRRRGDVGLRPHRQVVRHRPLERRARSHHDGEGTDQRLRAARRGRHAAGDCREVQGRAVPERAHLQQPSAGVPDGAGDDCGRWKRTGSSSGPSNAAG